MIAVIATVTIKAQREQEFEALFATLQQKVRRHEPETLVFELMRDRTAGISAYTILEQYRSADAWAGHKAADYTRKTVPLLHEVFERAAAQVLDSLEPRVALPASSD